MNSKHIQHEGVSYMANNTALLVIDVQVGLIDDPSDPSYNAPTVLANIAGLLAKARASRTPIIFIQHDGNVYEGEGLSLAPNSPGWQIHPSVAPLADEPVFRKRASDAFYQTPLQDELHASHIKHLVITGCRTEMCIDTTSRVAISRGFDVTLVQDAHSTTDSEIMRAFQIVAHHNYTLDDFGTDEHVIVTKAASEVEF